jgi:hypothetical protein
MNKIVIVPLVMVIGFSLLIPSTKDLHTKHLLSSKAIQPPVLKWQRGGCYSSWCETGWYSSPAVADIDQDGTIEVIGAAYTVFVLNGEDGTIQWSVNPSGGRVWPGIVICDLEGDGFLEILTAHGGGYLHVFNRLGGIKWSRHPTSSELRGLSVDDLDNNGTIEIIVSAAVGSKTNTWIYDSKGTILPGWPQLSNNSGYAYGVFNDNTAIGDLVGNHEKEIIVPSDVHYICAYRLPGYQIQAHSMYGNKKWGAVGVWESLVTELRGWGYCNGDRAERYRTNFAHGASVISDVNNDGIYELVVTGNVYDCESGHPPGKYNGIYIFNADRSRFKQDGYNWEKVPINTGAPLTENWEVIENNQPNPVVVDLNSDGMKEIIFSSYDGRVHAFWLDKTEHGNWPFSVYNSSQGYYQFASEPIVADLDRNGFAEVIFTSWVQKGSYRTGKIHILNCLGNVFHEVSLPAAFGGADWNGALPAPTIANIDSDPDYELVLNTSSSGIVAYDLPDSSQARILWQTGRGNFYRNGFDSSSPYINLIYPNGQESLPQTSFRNITWDAFSLSNNLKMALFQNGSLIGIIAENIDPLPGIYTWEVGKYIGGTAPVGSGYTIKIKEKGTALNDTSDSSFSISQPPYLKILSPNGGENLGLGQPYNITWEGHGLSSKIKITLWQNGSLIGVIASNYSPTAGSYPWTVGSHIGGVVSTAAGFQIKIKERDTSVSDSSDAPFHIVNPIIKLTSPNGGESWQLGSSQNINWTASGLTKNLYIVLQQNGTDIFLITKNIRPDLGSYSWIVGDSISGSINSGENYKIIIKEKNCSIKDKSDGTFVITE